MTALSEEGINRLEEIMLANCNEYNQDTFGHKTDCGKELCAAGFARLLKVGQLQFDAEVLAHTRSFSSQFCQACEADGIELLKMAVSYSPGETLTPQIFEKASQWPPDLYEAFSRTTSRKERVHFFIYILRTRVDSEGFVLNPDGSRYDPEEDVDIDQVF